MKKINVIPLAGEGRRFVEEGYLTPKPLIKINDTPMVINAAKCLPDADLWIFICLEKHIRKSKIDIILKNNFPNSIIIPVAYKTEGQASTCMLAEPYFSENDILTIGACDNGMAYNKKKYYDSFEKFDALIWTFRKNPVVLENPNMYGWVNMNFKDNTAISVSCKSPISQNPLNDNAIVGTFSFKRSKYFLESVRSMVSKNRRINNEFYMDIAIDECIKNGLSVGVFEIDNYYCWGTPKSYEKYIEELNE
tara:strand:- start:143 stop:892 length:750 start_codon:yes stop_codon:yes gene_type:complete